MNTLQGVNNNIPTGAADHYHFSSVDINGPIVLLALFDRGEQFIYT